MLSGASLQSGFLFGGTMKTSIQLIPTNKPHLFTILLHLDRQTRQIGKLDTRAEGTLHITRSLKHLFRKTQSIAINYELLHDASIKFKHIQIRYNGKKYYSTREYYLKNGFEQQYPQKGFELQTHIELDKLNINSVRRFEDSNWIQQDFFYQFS